MLAHREEKWVIVANAFEKRTIEKARERYERMHCIICHIFERCCRASASYAGTERYDFSASTCGWDGRVLRLAWKKFINLWKVY